MGALPPFEKKSCKINAEWRRRRDSNPRYGLTPYGGLANRWFQPLTHVSGTARARGYSGAQWRNQPTLCGDQSVRPGGGAGIRSLRGQAIAR